MEQVALRARVHHEARNWLILSDRSNAFNTINRTPVLAEADTCVPALTPFIAKCYGERPALVFFQMDSGSGKDRMFQRSAGRGRHGPGVVLHVAAASAEADP